ncbi:hypothetical protein ACV35D_33295, partial [Pseudomonas aeruginosa]
GAQAWQPERFRAGREQLDSRWGLLLPVALLSSGWLAALAVHAVRRGRPRQASQPELSRATVSNRPQRLSSCSRPARNSSGWLAALAVHAVRRGRPRQASGWLLAALLLALVYVGLKLHEYGRLADLGLDIEHDTFFTLY